ncbi:glycosyltransferase family 4 protein [uncultured Rhodoblastus sp.]|uniref:glycosyltransferase family 4 protein n=1 Tax=uncultured Rhodoblastus sp. TaxID=543037 RepID=UPI0025CBFF5B|nr:glycosyltransferase family 4 protein [uncultured Rhodoblastus sp.]
MKVAIVTVTLSHFEVPLFRLASSLAGLDVRVFHCEKESNNFFDESYGVVIDWGEDRRAGFPNQFCETPGRLARDVLAWKPDVVLQYGYLWRGAFAFFAQMRMRGIPVVHRGLLTPYRNTRQNALVGAAWRIIQPMLLRRFQAHHYGGSYSEAVLKRAGIPENRCYFVPFSVDTPHFASKADDVEEKRRALALRRCLGWAEDAHVLLFMCQQNWFKAPDVAVKAAAAAQKVVPGIKLIMAGSGSMTDELKALAASNLLPGSFHFPGFVQSKDSMRYYLASDLVMFPSRYDTWSRGVNEAMLARRPCIVSRVVPAAGGLVDDRVNGYVVDGLEPGGFVNCIGAYLGQSTAERASMGEAARARAMSFSYEVHADELYRSFTEVVL